MIEIQNIEVKNIFLEFNDFAAHSQDIAIFTRDISLQKEEIISIDSFINRLDEISAQENVTESERNLLLFLKFTIEAVKLEIQMMIALKQNEMDLAWGALIQSQSSISIAAGNHPFDSNQLLGFIQRLELYEQILFPRMVYASVGGIIKISKCSICHNDYEECDHMKGKFYNGELCVREIHEMELEEVSIVQNPASKFNRSLEKEYKGKKVNYLTLK